MTIHTPEDGRGLDRKFYLNGSEVKRVTYADTEKGIIEHFKVDEHGNILIDGDEALREVLHGDIKVTGCDKS